MYVLDVSAELGLVHGRRYRLRKRRTQVHSAPHGSAGTSGHHPLAAKTGAESDNVYHPVLETRMAKAVSSGETSVSQKKMTWELYYCADLWPWSAPFLRRVRKPGWDRNVPRYWAGFGQGLVEPRAPAQIGDGILVTRSAGPQC